jgi:hypothetical protein
MSILSSLTSILQLIKIPGIGVPNEDDKPTGPDDCGNGEHSKWNDDHQGRDDYSKGGDKDDYSKLSGNPGEALATFDFSHVDFGSHGPDHSGDIQGALASMSSDDALEYAIAQMGPADHFDVGHFDVPVDTSHDTGT